MLEGSLAAGGQASRRKTPAHDRYDWSDNCLGARRKRGCPWTALSLVKVQQVRRGRLGTFPWCE